MARNPVSPGDKIQFNEVVFILNSIFKIVDSTIIINLDRGDNSPTPNIKRILHPNLIYVINNLVIFIPVSHVTHT